MEPVRPELVRQTLFRLADDVEFAAVRIGMLGSGEVAQVVVDFLRAVRPPNVVLDPVIRSSSGAELIDAAGLAVLREHLLPLSDVITPNMEEAAELTDSEAVPHSELWDKILLRLRALAIKLHKTGCRGIVITGGELPEPRDYLSVWESGKTTEQILTGSRLQSNATHGTGCAFAMAVACGLAHGRNLPTAVKEAKVFVRTAIATAYKAGKGIGPMNHLYRLDGDF